VQTQSFDAWNAELERALLTLPELENIPHQLFSLVAQNADGPPKRFVLVTESNRTVAIVSLRKSGRHWEQIGHGVLPGTIFPSVPGYEIPAMRASGLDIWIGALDSPPPPGLVDFSYTIPVHRADCHGNYEEHWQTSGLRSFLKEARRHTKIGYEFEIDASGAAAWIIDRWAEQWQKSDETGTRFDLAIAFDYYRQHGMCHAFRLLHDGEPVAGATFFIDGGRRLIWQTSYHDDAYRKQGVGTRLLELIFQWAASSPYETLDLGGGHDYKARWAPENGHIWSYNVAPLYPRLRRRAASFVKAWTHRGRDRQ
jgi:GNAT superfamily N-acetyltransferase